MQNGGFRPTIVHGNAYQQVFRIAFGILDENIEIAVVIEYTGIQQFVLELFTGAMLIGLDKIFIGKFSLRILVEIFQVGVRGSAVHVEVAFLYVFPVIPFTVRQSKQALLENGIAPVPQGESKAQLLFVVGDACDSIFSPTIRASARLIMAEVIPSVPIVAIVLSDGAPLAFTEVRPPFLPRNCLIACVI